jgi:hypothetical protein
VETCVDRVGTGDCLGGIGMDFRLSNWHRTNRVNEFVL